MICYLFSKPLYFFFSSQVPALLYYAQIPATLIALIFSFYIFWNGRDFLLNRLLFLIALFFSFWTISTLIAWTNLSSEVIMFFWSFFGLILGLISIFSVYFIYVFLEKKDVSIKLKLIFLLLLAPIILSMTTYLNLKGFNITDCDAFKFESWYFKIYHTSLGVVAMIWILYLLVSKYRTASSELKKQILFMGTGIELFLFCFFGMEFVATSLTKLGILPDSAIELYGLFGMVIFMIYINILVVRFKTFNIKLLATQALVWGLAALIGSQFFFIKVPVNFVLNGITFVGIIIFGFFLIKSVKREVEQRQRLEQLRLRLEESNIKLEVANDKLKDLDKLKTEFLSLASHQLRSPLTAIKGYTSMVLEGDYGEINPKAKEAISRIFESSKNLTIVVEDLLNVSKIEQGGMKYEMAPFALTEIAEAMAKDLSVTAEGRGLKLTYKANKGDDYTVNGDKEKLRQVVLNFIDNSIKYTKTGSVNVIVERVGDKIRFAVKDTGMGMTPEIKASLFQKFARGDGARMNTSGSGLGLYLAKEIVAAHKGTVGVESDGPGKGSTFYMELNAVNK